MTAGTRRPLRTAILQDDQVVVAVLAASLAPYEILASGGGD